MSRLTARFCATRNVRPLGRDGNAIRVAMADPQDADTLAALRFAYRRTILPMPFSQREAESLLDQFLAKVRDLGGYARWQHVNTRPGSSDARTALPSWARTLVDQRDDAATWQAIADVMRRRLEWHAVVWRALILPGAFLSLIVLLHAPQAVAALVVSAAVAILIEPRPRWWEVAQVARQADIHAVFCRTGIDKAAVVSLHDLARLMPIEDHRGIDDNSAPAWQAVADRLDEHARLGIAAAARLYFGLAILAVLLRWVV